jgi:hypothetical protein
MIKEMVKENIFGVIKNNIMVYGKMIKWMVKENLYGPIKIYVEVHGKIKN